MAQVVADPPSAPVQTGKMSYEQFLKQYDGIHAEWVDGEVLEMPSVSINHQEVSGFLLRLIFDFVEQRRLGQVLFEKFQMRLPTRPSGREPDIIFVGNAHLPRLESSYLDGPGDLVVEVVSPESQERDRVPKFAEYQHDGVGEYWLIDPALQEALFFVLDDNGRFQSVTPDGEGIYHSVILPGLWLRVDWLWQRPLPPMTQARRELGLS